MGCTPSIYMGQKKVNTQAECSTKKSTCDTQRDHMHSHLETQKDQPNRSNLPFLVDKTLKDFYEMKSNLIKIKDNLLHQQKSLNDILNTDPDVLKKKNINIDKIKVMFSEIQSHITLVNANYNKVDHFSQRGEVMKILLELDTFQKSYCEQIKALHDDLERGYDFIRDRLIPLYKKCNLSDIAAIKEVPLPDPIIEEEFLGLDDSMHKLNTSNLVELADALSFNIKYDTEKGQEGQEGQEGVEYMKKDLFEHIHMIKMTLQHVARKDNKRNDTHFVKAYQSIENLLYLYYIQNNSFNVMKEGVNNVLSSLRSLT